MFELASKPVLRLGLIARMFEEFHEQDVLYCHWKSTEHLHASMHGETDFDVLFDKDQKDKVESVVRELGFKRFDAIRQKTYSDIVDYLGLDESTGRIIHLHTHYRLSIGKPYLKEFQFSFDIETLILARRLFNAEYGIFCIQPACELILLYIREALKLRCRDVLFLIRNRPRFNAFVVREYKWLKERVTDEALKDALKNIFPDYADCYPLMSGPFNTRQLFRLALSLKKKNGLERSYSPVASLFNRWYREATVIASRRLAPLLDRPIVFKRINPRGGLVVAVIGADGSGKSTVTENLKKTFEGKLDVYKIYFGRGDGKASASRKLLNSFKYLRKQKPDTKCERLSSSFDKSEGGFLRLLHKCVEAMLVAAEKRQNLSFIRTARKKGMLVICDRYPQNQIKGYNDGPLLHGLSSSGNPLLRSLARVESRVYSGAENQPPDIVFKLIADAATVEKRKPGETSLQKLESKISGIRQLTFKSPCKVVSVDATQPMPDVLHLIKTEIWKML